MTRALFVHEGLAWTGAARTFASAARGLAARGWQVAYACPEQSDVCDRLRALDVDVLPLPARASWLGEGERLRAVVAKRMFDALFVHSEHEHLAAATAVWRASRGVVVRRLGAGESLDAGRSVRAAMRLAPVVALCTWQEQAAAMADLSPISTVVADVGVDVDDVPPPSPVLGRAEGESELDALDRLAERRLVCVCDPGSRARTAVVLRAVAMLAPRHRELRLLLVGPGAEDEQLRMHAAALGIHRLVHHARGAADEALARAGAHVAWVTADHDDAAYGALDFMASGVPVLTDRDGVAARYVADNITGFHLVPGDVPGTAAALATLLARDDERAAMGNAGRARATRAFGEAAMIDGFARAASAAAERARRRG
ncbi:MAG: glycosyltransferase [Gemmatirosa sp.]|nr:glycosyltransferase [Gemmatirosa sp.]